MQPQNLRRGNQWFMCICSQGLAFCNFEKKFEPVPLLKYNKCFIIAIYRLVTALSRVTDIKMGEYPQITYELGMRTTVAALGDDIRLVKQIMANMFTLPSCASIIVKVFMDMKLMSVMSIRKQSTTGKICCWNFQMTSSIRSVSEVTANPRAADKVSLSKWMQTKICDKRLMGGYLNL